MNSYIKIPGEKLKGFLDFIREQGVVGLAIGFVLGGAVSKLVSAFVVDIINPLVGLLLGSTGDLKLLSIHVGAQEILLGDFLSIFIDFIIIAAVVYFGFKLLGLNNLDKQKS
jgi:large conductance mechanosensitive channel